MAGDTPFRNKRRLRRDRPSEAYQGGTGPAEGESTSAEREAALSPSPGTSDSGTSDDRTSDHGRDLPAPLEAARTGRLHSLKRGVAKSGAGVRELLTHLADRVIDMAPRIPVRDLDALRGQFPGLGPEELADKLIAGACNATATVGAGVGAAAMLPVPPAMMAELATEITGVAAIEMKLVAELHEVYGRRPPGGLAQRSAAYLMSWTEERGIDVTRPATLNLALGGRMRRELRQQIMKRMARDLPNLIPFMVGAAVGALMNRRDTRKLAERVRNDLRGRQIPWDRLPALSPLEPPAEPVKGLPKGLND